MEFNMFTKYTKQTILKRKETIEITSCRIELFVIRFLFQHE